MIYLQKMTLNELKIYGANALSFVSVSLNIDDVLKLTLVFASILYTVAKTVSIYKNEIRKPKKKKDE